MTSLVMMVKSLDVSADQSGSAQQWVVVRTSSIPHRREHLSIAQITWNNNDTAYMQKIFLCCEIF
jgi:hypothetical protein